MKSGEIDTDEPYETYDDEIEDIERMKDSIDVMPKKYRDVFVQTIQGANEKEISDKLSISPGTVKSRIYRGKKILMKLMNIKDGNQ